LSIKTEVFVDGGGCKGETTQLFASLFPDYQRIDIFEPDERNIVDAGALVSQIPRSCFHPIGLSDVSGTLYFDSGQGSASSVSEEGDVAISVDALDNVLLDATFIKLDLEGWELHALKGSEQNIRANKPKLAIGAYHRPHDFLDISDWVLGVRPDYRVALRHYTESWTESVLYFY
jgi:FkbM family methyltransferase